MTSIDICTIHKSFTITVQRATWNNKLCTEIGVDENPEFKKGVWGIDVAEAILSLEVSSMKQLSFKSWNFAFWGIF